MQPRGRADLEEFAPSVLVESPTVGEQVSSPLRIIGTANTFEATFNVEVVDAKGRVLGKRFVTATSGSGTRGTFDAEVPFKATGAGPGKLIVFELSAEDGSQDPRSGDSPANRALTARREHVQEERVAGPARMLWVADLT